MGESVRTWLAADADLLAAARLLHDFNEEFYEPSPKADGLAERLHELIADGDTIVMLAGDPACAVAVLRLRKAIFNAGLEAYLAELYVQPARRGHGVGRALMTRVIDVARSHGASRMEIGVDEPDAAARALYESLGFSNIGGEGVMFVYEKEL
jgi:GNAT superfamily N-acetyltransferase